MGETTGLTPATINRMLEHLQRVGLVVELTERQRGRVYAYRAYVDQINADLDDPVVPAPPQPGRRRAATP